MALDNRKDFLVIVNIFLAVVLSIFERLYKFYIFNHFLVKHLLIVKQLN